jgi:hypothetical protein
MITVILIILNNLYQLGELVVFCVNNTNAGAIYTEPSC